MSVTVIAGNTDHGAMKRTTKCTLRHHQMVNVGTSSTDRICAQLTTECKDERKVKRIKICDAVKPFGTPNVVCHPGCNSVASHSSQGSIQIIEKLTTFHFPSLFFFFTPYEVRVTATVPVLLTN